MGEGRIVWPEYGGRHRAEQAEGKMEEGNSHHGEQKDRGVLRKDNNDDPT
jgi:hypothetical protein